jgi:hypothetical protein
MLVSGCGLRPWDAGSKTLNRAGKEHGGIGAVAPGTVINGDRGMRSVDTDLLIAPSLTTSEEEVSGHLLETTQSSRSSLALFCGGGKDVVRGLRAGLC